MRLRTVLSHASGPVWLSHVGDELPREADDLHRVCQVNYRTIPAWAARSEFQPWLELVRIPVWTYPVANLFPWEIVRSYYQSSDTRLP